MKLRKIALTFGIMVLSVAVLSGCGSNEASAEDEEPAVEDVTSAPTSSRGETAEEMIESLSAEGPWVFGLADDITVDGALNIDGVVEMHSASGGGFTGEHKRKVALYARDADRNPIGAWNLTVSDGIIVNSPNTMFLAEGDYIAEVRADFTINTDNFLAENVEIIGDVVFATQEAKDTATAARWNADTEEFETVAFDTIVTGSISVE